MSLSSYLSSKYLTPEPATTGKKRKRKVRNFDSSGLTIADDDILGWSKETRRKLHEAVDGPLAINLKSSEIRKMKKNTWKKVGESSSELKPENFEADEAEKIIAQAAAENLATQNQDEQQPIVVDECSIVKMENGSHAGLQSARSVAEQFERKKEEEKAAWNKDEKSKKQEETIYRDATGRRIDLVMRRQELQREASLKVAKERAKREELNGDVQRAEKKKRKEAIDEVRFMPLTRTINDEDLNKELKEKERWNDPASKFMSQENQRKSSSKMPVYDGAAAPNRYNIQPGYRWDGVDRGNGWEAKRFNAINTAMRNKELTYSWQMDE